MSKENGKGGSAIVTPFKYRSIDDLAKIQILEQNRRGMEADHYALAFRLRTLEILPSTGDELKDNQRDSQIAEIRDQVALLESIISTYNDELLTLNESSKEKDE